MVDRFKDQQVMLAGQSGETLEIASANPVNYYEVISEPEKMTPVLLDGKLFLPAAGKGPWPLVIVVPGSLGVAPSHLGHAETLLGEGIAAFVLDAFGARHVTSTVSNQTQFSFAASAYDLLATFKALAELPMVDATRIGAQGHSRGGSAVMTAATRCFASSVLGSRHFAGILAAYPWCGQQFLDPSVGTTKVCVLMGDHDEWCSPMQVQGHCQAIRLTGGDVSLRLFGGAQHSFDRDTALENIAEASVSPAAPTTYIDDQGAMLHPLQNQPDPALVDRDVMVYALKAGYGRRGAQIGSHPGEAARFKSDMVSFWRSVLLDS